MFLKKVIPLLALFLPYVSSLQAGSFLNGNDLCSQEIVIQYSGEKGYLHILEYNIRTLKKSKADKQAQATQMIEDAETNSFCKKRFNLKDFTSRQETFTVKDRQLNAEYHLMTHGDDTMGLLKKIVSEILGEEVNIEVSPKIILMQYSGTDYHAAAGSNAIGPAEKDGKFNLFWIPGMKNFQLVFNTDEKGRPIRKLFPDKVGSPELTSDEINNWRNQ